MIRYYILGTHINGNAPAGIYLGDNFSRDTYGNGIRWSKLSTCPSTVGDISFSAGSYHIFKNEHTAQQKLNMLLKQKKLNIDAYSFKVISDSEMVALIL